MNTKTYKSKKEWKDDVEEKTATLFNLFRSNEFPVAYDLKIKEALSILCSSKANVEVKLNGSRTCSHCFVEFMPTKDVPIQSACKCMSFHKSCLLNKCKDASSEYETQAFSNISCIHCGKKFSPSFIEDVLAVELKIERDRIYNIKNRKVQCNLCNQENIHTLMYERHCGHSFCKNCFIGHLDGILHRNKGNIRDFVCPAEKCQEPRIDYQEIKTYVKGQTWIIYDDYLYRIYDAQKQNEIVFKCKTEDCPKIRGATLESKDKDYQCLECEEKKKEGGGN